MNPGTKAATRRLVRSRTDTFEQRRDALALAALAVLADLGYARTGLRDIAQRSEYSLGSVHYYFDDKIDLIAHCVRLYKAECITRYDAVVAESQTADELMTGFAVGLATTMRDEGAMHRLWYDLRNQSQFEGDFRGAVPEIDASLERMIWRIVSRYGELSEGTIGVTPSAAYALFDGLFQRALLDHLAGAADAGEALERAVEDLLPRLLGPAVTE